jgi:hypothetical protein
MFPTTDQERKLDDLMADYASAVVTVYEHPVWGPTMEIVADGGQGHYHVTADGEVVA